MKTALEKKAALRIYSSLLQRITVYIYSISIHIVTVLGDDTHAEQ